MSGVSAIRSTFWNELSLRKGILTQEECDAISKAKEAEVEEAVEFARNSPYPEPEELFDDMWADPIPAP